MTVSLGTPSTGVTQEVNKNGIYKFLIPSIKIGSEMNEFWIYWTASNWTDGNSANVSDIVLIEGDYTNVDIPYFEGMQSVQMPVLKTTGKNTFNIKNKGACRADWYSIPLELSFSGEIYVKGTDSLPSDFRVNIFANNREYSLSNSDVKNGCITNFQNVTAIDFHCPSLSIACHSRGKLDDLIANGNIVIELDGEPYKSNILTVNEDVTLRGIGKVQDTLDLMTGEKVERIGEVVYDGSDDENWDITPIQVDGLIGIATKAPSDMKYLGANRIDGFINNQLKQALFENMSIFSGYGGWHMFAIYMDSSTFDSAQKIKQWLSQNPITVQYELATESIKTVDLTIHDKDHQKVERLTTFEGGTHFTTSSQDGSLLPTLSVDVVTDLEKTLMVCSLEGNTM